MQSCTWGASLSHNWMGNLLWVVPRAPMNLSLNVWMACSAVCGVDPVVVRFNQLECHLLWGEVRLDSFGGLVVHDVYFWFEPFAYQIFEVFYVCL